MSGLDETEVKAIKSFCKGPYNIVVYLSHSSAVGYRGSHLILVFQVQVFWLSHLCMFLQGGTMGRNKLLQRGNFSSLKRCDLTHLWKPSSLFIAYLALMPLSPGKGEFNQMVLQTSLHLQKAALQVLCNT